jgi:hypothetical protein
MSSGSEQHDTTTAEATPTPPTSWEESPAATTQGGDQAGEDLASGFSTLNVNAAVFVPSWMPSTAPSAPAPAAAAGDSPSKTPSGKSVVDD